MGSVTALHPAGGTGDPEPAKPAATPRVAPVRLPDGVQLHTILHDCTGTDPLTVVFVHGWTLDHRLWRRQVADLVRRLGTPVRLLAFDLRGHGRSSPTRRGGATIEQLGDDLAAVLRERAPSGRVILVGHSLGGMAVMEYAHRHPAEFMHRVAGVVLVSTSAQGSSRTSYGLHPGVAWLVRMIETRGAGLLARSGPWPLHRPLMPLLSPGVRWLVFGPHADEDAISFAATMVGGASLTAIGGFRPSVAVHDRIAALAAMRDLPVAVLVGSADRLTPPSCAEAIAAALPNAVLRVCEGAGHMLPIERPDDVTDAIAAVCREAVHQRASAEPSPAPVSRWRRWWRGLRGRSSGVTA
jgi:pimeloyl-ACP methyl ester carboxylesterase